ncbi:hypothetical protein HYV86_02540 [Candidatus Woesearchaeota archaeon]|nr:hypothetical protein [Candidatus Woesearchaeota archaeon]
MYSAIQRMYSAAVNAARNVKDTLRDRLDVLVTQSSSYQPAFSGNAIVFNADYRSRETGRGLEPILGATDYCSLMGKSQWGEKSPEKMTDGELGDAMRYYKDTKKDPPKGLDKEYRARFEQNRRSVDDNGNRTKPKWNDTRKSK